MILKSHFSPLLPPCRLKRLNSDVRIQAKFLCSRSHLTDPLMIFPIQVGMDYLLAIQSFEAK